VIRPNEDKLVAIRERLFDGDGQVTVRSLLNNEEEMYHKGRVFAHTTLLPSCSIGYHVHSNESETYYVYSGIGEFNDNGNLKTVYAGDVTITLAGQGHGIRNIGDEPLELIALILYE
jgi:mannose-6-phosphate isomerase-like protein (cupin superfamily)